jgi:hypothetical protein
MVILGCQFLVHFVQIVETGVRLETSKKEIDKQLELAKALEVTVIASLGDHKFLAYLVKVFKKRMKRKIKTVGENEGCVDTTSLC